MKEQENNLLINNREHSGSARIFHKIVLVSKPNQYETLRLFSHVMRCTDNLVDEGENFQEAKVVLDGQRRILSSLWQGDSPCPQTVFEQELAEVIGRIPSHLKRPFIGRYSDLLSYFGLDLLHRLQLTPYNKPELEEHIKGGFTSFFAGLKIILNGEDLSGNGRYLSLTRVHGKVEPLGDIAEDLERGLILHVKEDGAEWVDKLRVDNEVPTREIDSYVLRNRGRFSKRMFHLAPAAFEEFGGIIGLLMTMDYYKRSLIIARWRFSPKKPVVFAKKRMFP